jgi:hypothetical protein
MASTSGASRAAAKPAAKPVKKGALAAGAARASGERAKRRSTPLIASAQPPTPLPPVEQSAVPTEAAAPESPASSSNGKHRPRPVAKSVPSRKAVSRSGARATKASTSTRSSQEAPGEGKASARHTAEPRVRTLKAVTDETVVPVDVVSPAASAAPRSIAPGVEELLTAGIAAVRVAAEAAGISSDDVERHIASLLSFVRRRVTGDYTVDEFGFDEDFTRHFYLPVLRPLYRSWFRVEVRGIENIPAEGGGLVVANHSGTVAMDSLMTQVAVHDEHPAHRHLRMLGADLVFSTPVVS